MINTRCFGFTVSSEEIADLFKETVGRKPTDKELDQIMDTVQERLNGRQYKYGYTELDVMELVLDFINDNIEE